MGKENKCSYPLVTFIFSMQPLSLKQLTEGLRDEKSSRTVNIWKLFTNVLCLLVPKEEEHMRTFNNQIEEDKEIIVPRDNLTELHKVKYEPSTMNSPAWIFCM